MARKIIQIAAGVTTGKGEGRMIIAALCNDGTLWVKAAKEFDGEDSDWIEVEDIPQDEFVN